MNDGSPLLAIFVAILFLAVLPAVLPIVGVLWAPFAALICARIARKKGLSVWRYAAAGAVYSALFFWPWVYLIARMHNKSIPSVLIHLFYILVFLAWLPGTTTATFVNAFGRPAVESYVMFAGVILNIVTWFIALRRLLGRRGIDIRNCTSDSRSSTLPSIDYLTPIAGAVVWMVFLFSFALLLPNS